MALLLRVGADAHRMIDGHGWPIERFAAHIGRMKALRGTGALPLLVLTQTNPIALTILQTRRVLENAVPELGRAPWIIFHDESADPYFARAAEGLGTFDIGYELGPIWRAPDGHRFLVVGQHPTHLDTVPARLAALELELVSGIGHSRE